MASISRVLRSSVSRISTHKFFALACNPVPNQAHPFGFKKLASLGNNYYAKGLLGNAYLHVESRQIVVNITVISKELSVDTRNDLINHSVDFIEKLMLEINCDYNRISLTGHEYGAEIAEYCGMLMSIPVISFDSTAKSFENIEESQYHHLTRYFLNHNGYLFAKQGAMIQVKSQQCLSLAARWKKTLEKYEHELPDSIKKQTLQDNWNSCFAENGEPIHCEIINANTGIYNYMKAHTAAYISGTENHMEKPSLSIEDNLLRIIRSMDS